MPAAAKVAEATLSEVKLTAVEMLEKELAEVQAKLEGYGELKAQESRLAQAIRILKGEGPRMLEPGMAPTRSRASNGRSKLDDEQIIGLIRTMAPIKLGAIYEGLNPSERPSKALVGQRLGALVEAGTIFKDGERNGTTYSMPT